MRALPMLVAGCHAYGRHNGCTRSRRLTWPAAAACGQDMETLGHACTGPVGVPEKALIRAAACATLLRRLRADVPWVRW
jgi:hypothetical protein